MKRFALVLLSLLLAQGLLLAAEPVNLLVDGKLENPSAWQLAGALLKPGKDSQPARVEFTGSEYNLLLSKTIPITAVWPNKLVMEITYRLKLSSPDGKQYDFAPLFSDKLQKTMKNPEGSEYLVRLIPDQLDWKTAKLAFQVPKDAVGIQVLIQCFSPGLLEIKSCRLMVNERLLAEEKEAKTLLSKPLAKSQTEKKWPDEPLRGTGLTACQYLNRFPSDEIFKKLKSMNVNVVRLWMEIDLDSPWTVKNGETIPPVPLDDPMAPYRQNILGLRIALALGEKYHIFVIPVVSGVLGRGSDDLVAKEKVEDGSASQSELQEKQWNAYVENLCVFWEYIAKNFGDNPWLLGYDLLNEPHTKKEVELWHSDMLPKIVSRIRAIDKNTWLVVETAPWDLPDQAFPATLTPINDPKTVYSMHFYYPHTYTHQGIGAYVGPEYEGKRYPGFLKLFPSVLPMFWNKSALEDSMNNVFAFQKKYGVKIFVGEFSVARWAQGAAQWVADTTELFDKYHWSWTFHHVYGNWWNGWNPTFDPGDPQSGEADGGKMTDELKVLMKAWGENEKF